MMRKMLTYCVIIMSRILDAAHRICLGLSVILLAVAASSCQPDLVYPDDHTQPSYVSASVNVSFNWSKAPDADPKEMSLISFRGAAQPVQFQFVGREGGSLMLSEGERSFLAYNSDNEYYTRGGSWADFEVFSNQTDLHTFSRMFASTRSVPKTRGTEDQPVIYEPEELWTGNVAYHWLDIVSVKGTIYIPMRVSSYVYNFVINNVKNLKYVVEVSGTLSGMSESVYPSTGRPSDTASIIPFLMEKSGDSAITGSVRTLGHCPLFDSGEYYRHYLTVYAEMTSGEKYYYALDVTPQMHDLDHLTGGNTEVPIVINDGLPLPKPIVNGSGMQPKAAEWYNVDIDLRP